MSFLQLTDIHKTYDNAPLLYGVTFTVERGEIACLLGPSGSGKTTLLRIIAGLEGTKSGRVVLDGQDLTHVPTHRRGVVLMFQDYALFPHKTVAENVAFGLRMQATSRKQQVTSNKQQAAEQSGYAVRSTQYALNMEQRVETMLSLVGLSGFGERDVNSLSGGERQRVALARSLAPNPRLLLLDEPLGALDRNLRERLLEELPAILRQVGVTAITVTHDQEEAFALADRVILLHEGRVVQQGAPAEVYDAPANTWVARFLGLRNLLPATVSGPHEVHTACGPLQLAREVSLPEKGRTGNILVHPWGIRLGAGTTNTLQGQVSRRTFHGQHYQLTVQVGEIALRFIQHPGAHPPPVGARVTLHLQPEILRWLSDDL